MVDLIIIGGGPGGYIAALEGAKKGLQVTLIEKEKVGGTCLHRGCIPTKILYRHSEVLRLIKESEKFGFTAELTGIDTEAINNRQGEIIAQLEKGIETLLLKQGVELVRGEATFVDDHRVKVMGHEELVLEGKHIMIATGSKPSVPPIPGLEFLSRYKVKDYLKIIEIPKTLLVIGGGVIGMEMACIYNELGSQVIVVEMEKNILPGIEGSLSKRAKAIMKKRIDIRTSTKVTQIHSNSGRITVELEDKKGITFLEVEDILLSTGRVPNVDELGLNNAGIEFNHKGIHVDQYYRTNIPHIYAIGDVNGLNMLAHAASYQGGEAVEKIVNESHEHHDAVVPSCIFTTPEIASVGITSEEAKSAGIKVRTSQYNFVANGKALALGEGEGFVKVIADEENVLLGVHIIGPHASDLINECVVAVQEKLNAGKWKHIIHPHPTLGEAVHEAILGIK